MAHNGDGMIAMGEDKAGFAACASDRRCLILDLHDDADLIAEYEARHRPGGPPAAVTRSIRAAGIVEMEIWRAGNRLVMMVEVAPGYDAQAKAARDAADPEVRAWEASMDRYQQRLGFAGAGEKWVAAHPIYRLSDQP